MGQGKDVAFWGGCGFQKDLCSTTVTVEHSRLKAEQVNELLDKVSGYWVVVKV